MNRRIFCAKSRIRGSISAGKGGSEGSGKIILWATIRYISLGWGVNMFDVGHSVGGGWGGGVGNQNLFKCFIQSTGIVYVRDV